MSQRTKLTLAIVFIIAFILGGVFLWPGVRAPKKTAPKEVKFSQERAAQNATSNWQLVTNKTVGYSLKYPPQFKALTKQEFRAGDLIFGFSEQKIGDYTPTPGSYYASKAAMVKDEKALANGEFGSSPAFSLKESQRVVRIDHQINGKEFVTLAKYEECEVLPTRTLIFFKNGYYVVITMQVWPAKTLKTELPQYFTTDEKGCGHSLIWNWKTNSPLQFYNDLVNKKISPTTEAGIWYNTFDKIVSTIRLF